MKQATQLHIKTLTPLHIGSGRELQGNFEYLYFSKDKRIALIDEMKVLNLIGEAFMSQWLGVIERQDSLLDLLKQRSTRLKPQDAALRIMAVQGPGPANYQAIMEQLHNGLGQALLPGSSIKGAMRTAVFTDALGKKPELVKNGTLMSKRSHGRDGLEGRLFGNSPNEDIFRLMRPGDAHFGHTEVFKTKTLNKKHDGWVTDDRISPFVECVPTGAESLFQVSRPEQLIDYLGKNQRQSPFNGSADRFGWNELSQLINAHTQKLLADELTFWDHERMPALVGEYVQHLTMLLQAAKDCEPGSCVMRIGFGSGVNFLTGGWQKELMEAKDYLSWANRFRGSAPQLAFPKTRKLAYNDMPLGFVKLTAVTAEQKGALLAHLKKAQIEAQTKLQKTYVPPKVIPQYPKRPVRRGSILDGFVFAKPAGRAKKVRVYIGKGQDIDIMMNYRDDSILGKIILVEVREMRKGKVTAIAYKKPKTENR